MCVSILQRGQYVEVCVFASILCIYDLRESYLFILSWPRVSGVSSVVFIGDGAGV